VPNRGSAAWYRREAEKLRDMAEKATTDETRTELTRLALAFDRLADHANRQKSEKRED
jgi:hypothetical protein